MAFPESFLQELAERNDIVDVVSSYVRLTKKSGSNLFGLCPFHSERRVVFRLAGQADLPLLRLRQRGRVISFVMDVENLPT